MTRDTRRREFLKSAGTVFGAGALGSLAGCTGGGGGGDGGDGGDGGGDGGDGGGGGGGQATEESDGGDGGDGQATEESDGGGGDESVTISLWSGLAAENSPLTNHFQSSMKNYQEMEGVTVDLQPISYGDIKSKLVSAVEAGNSPDLASSGTAGIDFFLNDKVGDHNAWVEETGIADQWLSFNTESANFRGDWWAGGTVGANATMLTLRPKYFKEVGFNEPSQLRTWSQFTEALEAIQNKYPRMFPYEESGVWNDLESYWGQAQTSWTDGEDPWITGDPTNPTIRIGDEPRTDGMIKACVDRARTFSSPDSPKRTDEEMPALMLGDRVASNTTGFGNPQRWRSQNPDVTFGWDGDIWQGPIPKVDPDYGERYSDLSGVEGEHGGSTSGLESQNQVFATGVEDQAFDLQYYMMTNEDHVVPIIGEYYGNVAGFSPINEVVQQEYDLVQIQQAMIQVQEEYTSQYRSTGAAWDIDATDAIRWDALNKNISAGIAGQIDVEDVPSVAREDALAAIQG